MRAQFFVDELNFESRFAKLEEGFGRNLEKVSKKENKNVSVRRNYGCLYIFIEQGEMIIIL